MQCEVGSLPTPNMHRLFEPALAGTEAHDARACSEDSVVMCVCNRVGDACLCVTVWL